jgi:PST family polysaccharide transporter
MLTHLVVVLRNVGALFTMQLVSYVLSLLTYPYLIRVIGLDFFGLVSLAQVIMYYLTIILDFGFNISAVQEISVNRDKKEKVSRIHTAVFFTRIILCGVCSLAVMAVLFFGKYSTELWPLLLYALTIPLGHALFPFWLFQGLEKVEYSSYSAAMAKILFTLPIFFTVCEPNDYFLVPLWTGMGGIAAGLTCLWLTKSKLGIGFERISIGDILEQLKGAFPFFVSRVFTYATPVINVLVLSLTGPIAIVGIYTVAEKIATAIQALYAPIVQVLFPLVAYSRRLDTFKVIFWVANLGNCVLVFMAYLFSYKIASLVIGDVTWVNDVVEILKIFWIICLVMAPSMMIGYPFLGALGYAQEVNYSTWLGSLCHVVIVSILVTMSTAHAVYLVASLLAAEVLMFAFRLRIIKKKVLSELENSNSLKGISEKIERAIWP